MSNLLLLALGYLLGSIPVAYLVARVRGVDVFQTGTGNPGAANVFRKVGRGPGLVVLAGDVLKGAVPVVAAQIAGVTGWWALGAGLAALAGHWYPVFLRFRGGAGLATAIGEGYALMPLPSLVGTLPALAWLAWRRDTGTTAAVGFPVFFVSALLLKEPPLLALAICVLPALALARERLLPRVGMVRRDP
ncbi:MAG: glycerol-3-phosphate acyltransferase [Chloroflexi bacterium]|nr:glycerol-3-phosphate acyltransferase [Chloroflexota bacterium]